MEGSSDSGPGFVPEEGSLETLADALSPIIRAMGSCFDQKLVLPAMMLFYSAVDSVAALEAPSERSSQQGFRGWVDQYLLKSKPLSCNSLDLWAARCGILHTLSAQ